MEWLKGGVMIRDYIMTVLFVLAASFVVHRLLRGHVNPKRFPK